MSLALWTSEVLTVNKSENHENQRVIIMQPLGGGVSERAMMPHTRHRDSHR